jgi:hypothetical protein
LKYPEAQGFVAAVSANELKREPRDSRDVYAESEIVFSRATTPTLNARCLALCSRRCPTRPRYTCRMFCRTVTICCALAHHHSRTGRYTKSGVTTDTCESYRNKMNALKQLQRYSGAYSCWKPLPLRGAGGKASLRWAAQLDAFSWSAFTLVTRYRDHLSHYLGEQSRAMPEEHSRVREN